LQDVVDNNNPVMMNDRDIERRKPDEELLKA
jgi:hypothetical protein